MSRVERNEIDEMISRSLESRDLESRDSLLRSRLAAKMSNQAYKTYASVEEAPANFVQSLLEKKEFYDHRFKTLTIRDFDRATSEACSPTSFERSPSQEFTRNYMSPHTPYGGLILFHDVGVGKTCSAVSIAERFHDRPKTIIAPLNVHSTFKKNLFDIGKVRISPKGLESDQCSGSSFLPRSHRSGLTKEDVETFAEKRMSKYYSFVGFTKFANIVEVMTDGDIREAYDGHVFIVDEAHNLRSSTSSRKPIYNALKRVLKICIGVKIVLMTATPMYNDAREIVDMVNLLLLNDRRSLLKTKELFTSEGSLRDEDEFTRSLIGYVSRLPGRTPLKFPLIFDARTNRDPNVLSKKDLPRRDITGVDIPRELSLDVERTTIVASHMSPHQYGIYRDSLDSTEISGISEISDVSEISDDSEMSEKVEKEDLEENEDGVKFGIGFERGNVVYPGAKGFWSCFSLRSKDKEFQVKYVKEHEGYLSPKNLSKVACKFKTVIDRILVSRGIVFVYSRFLWSGLVPLAIALEHEGFDRYGKPNILHSTSSRESTSSRGSYIILSSNHHLCSKKTFAMSLDAATSPENADGSKVRVILACGVATEGIDFKCIRSLHVIDPWYNFNKIKQIIGRASRNCSHRNLSLEDRNVSVYLHAALPPSKSRDFETVDLHAYRISQFKQIRIEQIERVLSNVSIDCQLNSRAQQLEAVKNVVVPRVVTGLNVVLKNYRIVDNFSQDRFKCLWKTPETAGTNKDTYDPLYHNSRKIDVYLERILTVLGKSKLANIRELYRECREQESGEYGDRQLFVLAVQRGLDEKKIDYRGGIYSPL